MFSVAANLVGDHVLNIADFLLTGAKRHRNCSHILSGGRGVRLIYNDCKTLTFQSGYTVHYVWKFLNSCGYDLRIAVQCNRKVCRITLLVHNTDKTCLVFHTNDSFLELPVNHNTVGNDDYIVKDDLIVGIMQRSKSVCKPGNRIRLA